MFEELLHPCLGTSLYQGLISYIVISQVTYGCDDLLIEHPFDCAVIYNFAPELAPCESVGNIRVVIYAQLEFRPLVLLSAIGKIELSSAIQTGSS